MLGIGLFGYDWSGGNGAAVSWLRAFRLSLQHHAPAHYDNASQSPWFSYTDAAGHKHTVWFENEAELAGEVRAPRWEPQIGGVFLWMFGYEDTGTWTALHHTLPLPPQLRSSGPCQASVHGRRRVPGIAMIPWWLLAVLVLGVNFAVWGAGRPQVRRPAG